MKRSERIKERLTNLQNDVYNSLNPRGRKIVNKLYRGKLKVSKKVKERAPQGRATVRRTVLRSTASLDTIVMRDILGDKHYRSRSKKTVGK